MDTRLCLVIVVCFCHCNAIRIPPQWCSSIIKLCENFDDDSPIPPSASRIYCLQSLMDNPIMYLAPPVILWSPLEQFRHIIINCPKCVGSGSSNAVALRAVGWRNGGQGDRSEPRKVYGTSGVTLLVGRVYKCMNGHEVVGYHPGVLDQLPDCFIPFQLWHITGFTTDFMNLITSLITAGMSINGIRTFLYKQYVSFYFSKVEQFQEMIKLHSGDSRSNSGPGAESGQETFPTLSSWKKCFSSFLPSIHAISGCFLADFWTKQKIYTQCMRNTTIDETDSWLSLDHTFSSASKLSGIYMYYTCMCIYHVFKCMAHINNSLMRVPKLNRVTLLS